MRFLKCLKVCGIVFNIGQTVLYGSNGVCTVDGVTEKRVGSFKANYYVLKPVGANAATLFVPTSNTQLVSRIRRGLTEDEANRILDDLPDCGEWIDDKQQRTEDFRAIIAKGDCVELIRLIRLIHAHELSQTANHKRLHVSDERFMKEATKMVCEEFSIVLHTDSDSIMKRILVN